LHTQINNSSNILKYHYYEDYLQPFEKQEPVFSITENNCILALTGVTHF